jgi:hypothetical protein
MSDENKVPTVTIKVVDVEKWGIELSVECPSPDYALNMLDTARRYIVKTMQDAEAAQFGTKMEQAAQAHRAMVRGPLIRQ